jgi:hypothetical protein
MLNVRCSICPQCLETGMGQILSFDLYIHVYTKPTHDAWQAGVHFNPPPVTRNPQLATRNPQHATRNNKQDLVFSSHPTPTYRLPKPKVHAMRLPLYLGGILKILKIFSRILKNRTAKFG